MVYLQFPPKNECYTLALTVSEKSALIPLLTFSDHYKAKLLK